MDLDAVRHELEQVVREAQGSVAALEHEEAHETGEPGSSDQHPADTASDVSEADREDALVEAAVQRGQEATEALARLDAGTYGACVDCGQPIAPERLDFRPEAARCLPDQETFEAAG